MKTTAASNRTAAAPQPPRNNADAYRLLMEQVELPDRVRANVMEEARTLHAKARRAGAREGGGEKAAARIRAAQTAEAVASTAAPAAKRQRMRALAIAAGIVLAVGAGAFALAPWSRSVDAFPNGNPAAGEAPEESGNFFALAAYADEVPTGESGQTVMLDLGALMPDGGSGRMEYHPVTGETYDDDSQWLLSLAFDARCTGRNVQEIKYELVGGDLYFEWYDEEQWKRAHGIYGADDPAVQEGYQIYADAAFSVDYSQHDMEESAIHCKICIPFRAGDGILELYQELVTMPPNSRDQFEAKSIQLHALSYEQALQKLAQCQIKLTATFSDGSAQTKAYAIAPVDDVAQKYIDYRNACSKAWKETGTAENIENPQLYTLTELSE